MRETWVLGLRDPMSLTEPQRLQLNATLHVWFNNAQNWFYQMKSGVLDSEIADGHWTTMATMYRSFPGFREYWESRGYSYTPEFQRFVKEEVFTRQPLDYTPDPLSESAEMSPEVKSITAQLNEIYAVSNTQGDADALAARHLRLLTDQPTVIPPGQDPIVGRDAVSDFYRQIFSEVEILENSYSNLSIDLKGNLATRSYVGSGTMRANGKTEWQTTKTQMTDVLIKDKGKWKTMIHSWSPLSPE